MRPRPPRISFPPKADRLEPLGGLIFPSKALEVRDLSFQRGGGGGGGSLLSVDTCGISLRIPSSPPTVWRSMSLRRWAKGGDLVASIHRPVERCRFCLPASMLRGRFVIEFCVTHWAQIPLRSSPFQRATSAAVVRGRGVRAALGCSCARPCGKLRGRFLLNFPSSVIISLPRYACVHLCFARAAIIVPFPVFLPHLNFIFTAQFVVSAFSLISWSLRDFSHFLISRFSSPRDHGTVISAFHLRPASSVLRPASPHPNLCLAILRFHIAVSCVNNRVYLSSPPRNHMANVSSFSFRVAPAASPSSRFSQPSRFSSPRGLSHF